MAAAGRVLARTGGRMGITANDAVSNKLAARVFCAVSGHKIVDFEVTELCSLMIALELCISRREYTLCRSVTRLQGNRAAGNCRNLTKHVVGRITARASGMSRPAALCKSG